MKYLYLFLVNGILGFYLQAIGYVLMIWAIGRRKISLKDFFIASVLFSIVAFGIRSLTMISFGFHTILIMIFYILIGTKLFKNKVYNSALAVLMTAILIIVCEIINFCLLQIWFDTEVLGYIMKNDRTITGQIKKAVLGIPTNLFQIVITYIIYKFEIRKIKKTESE